MSNAADSPLNEIKKVIMPLINPNGIADDQPGVAKGYPGNSKISGFNPNGIAKS